MINTNKIKEGLRHRTIPVANAFLEPFLTAREFFYDARRYVTYSTSRDGAVTRRSSTRAIEAQLTKDYHRIEKGLTLLQPKRPFGSRVESRISTLLPELQKRSPNAPEIQHSETAIKALRSWNEGAQVDEVVAPAGPAMDLSDGGLTTGVFFASRHSVRNFDKSRVPTRKLIDKAAMLAQTTPSVCNRQAGRLHIYTDAADVQRILQHQNGNSGFSETVPAVAIVTVDTRLFTGIHERHQRWIDGGLFAMTFVWALHALGVQSCMLNWSRNNRDSDQLRKGADIDQHEDIIVMVAFGYGTNDYRIARSPKRALSEVAQIHDHGSKNRGVGS